MKRRTEWISTAVFIAILALFAHLFYRTPMTTSEGTRYSVTEQKAQAMIFEIKARYEKNGVKISANELPDAIDYWGNPFEIRYQAEGAAEIRSAAVDGKIDTEDDFILKFRYK